MDKFFTILIVAIFIFSFIRNAAKKIKEEQARQKRATPKSGAEEFPKTTESSEQGLEDVIYQMMGIPKPRKETRLPTLDASQEEGQEASRFGDDRFVRHDLPEAEYQVQQEMDEAVPERVTLETPPPRAIQTISPAKPMIEEKILLERERETHPLTEQLKDPHMLKTAVLFREILGSPLAIRRQRGRG